MSGLTPLASGQVTPDLRTSELKQPIDVAEYLFRRLHQVGVRSVHGLPGDYNLVALDYLPKTNLNWVGNVNELNAGTSIFHHLRTRHTPLSGSTADSNTHLRLRCRWLRKNQGHFRHCHHLWCW